MCGCPEILANELPRGIQARGPHCLMASKESRTSCWLALSKISRSWIGCAARVLSIASSVPVQKNCCTRPTAPYARFPPRISKDVEKAVRNAALHGRLPGDRGLPSHQPLFTEGPDPKSRVLRWFPTAYCTNKRYEEVRKLLGGVHMVLNAFWAARHYDYYALVRFVLYFVLRK